MNKTILCFLIAAASLFSGCGIRLIAVCNEKPSDIANAYKYTDQRPLTADGLKQLLMDDTLHYKVVLFYSYCCGACREQMRDTYSKIWNVDTSLVRWYFVQRDCSGLKYNNTDYLKRYGIETPYMYYLRDDDPRFRTGTENQLLNIAQYVFDKETELVDIVDGIPNVLVVNPKGKLKMAYHRYDDGQVVLGNFEHLEDMIYSETTPEYIPLERSLGIQDLNFDQRDTIRYYGNYTQPEHVCTPQGCH